MTDPMKLPSRNLRRGLMILYVAFALVAQIVLFGLLGHYETSPTGTATADGLFKGSLVIVAILPLIASVPAIYFGFKFLRIITTSLEAIRERDPMAGEDTLQTAQIVMIVAKVFVCFRGKTFLCSVN